MQIVSADRFVVENNDWNASDYEWARGTACDYPPPNTNVGCNANVVSPPSVAQETEHLSVSDFMEILLANGSPIDDDG